jgi:hypothetical protein
MKSKSIFSAAVWICFCFLLVSSHHLPAVQVPVELMKLPNPLLTVMMQARRLNIIPPNVGYNTEEYHRFYKTENV